MFTVRSLDCHWTITIDRARTFSERSMINHVLGVGTDTGNCFNSFIHLNSWPHKLLRPVIRFHFTLSFTSLTASDETGDCNIICIPGSKLVLEAVVMTTYNTELQIITFSNILLQ